MHNIYLVQPCESPVYKECMQSPQNFLIFRCCFTHLKALCKASHKFFRWIKQNIVIKTLWGYSRNAVNTQLWVAICAYLLLAWVKKAYRSSYTVTEIATLVSVSLFEKTDLNELLTAPDEKPSHLNSNQNVKELTLF